MPDDEFQFIFGFKATNSYEETTADTILNEVTNLKASANKSSNLHEVMTLDREVTNDESPLKKLKVLIPTPTPLKSILPESTPLIPTPTLLNSNIPKPTPPKDPTPPRDESKGKEKGKAIDTLRKSLKAKFEWIKTQAGKLSLPPPPELSTFGLLAAKKKRKRTSELIKKVFVKEDIKVDGMGTPKAEEMFKKLDLIIEARNDVNQARIFTRDNLDGGGIPSECKASTGNKGLVECKASASNLREAFMRFVPRNQLRESDAQQVTRFKNDLRLDIQAIISIQTTWTTDEAVHIALKAEQTIKKQGIDSYITKKSEDGQRHNIFQTRCKINQDVFNVIIDKGSSENIISWDIMTRLKLTPKKHLKPYNIGWIKAIGEKTNTNDEYYYKNEGVIVLGVYLHCEACVSTVLKTLIGIDGVEEVEPNMEENQVIVKGTACYSVRIAARVKRKLGKRVAIISPVPIKKQEKKEEPPKVTETVLKMHMHCEGCAEDVRHRLQKMKGVESVKPDMNVSTVTVKGTVDPKDIITFIYKKTRKRAENQNQNDGKEKKKQKDQNQNQNDGKEKKKQKDQNQNQNDGKEKKKQKDQNQNQNDGKEKDSKKKEEKDSENKDERTIGLSYPYDPRGLDYTTEILSDVNTDACSIM
uniref:HMA domain-containing protein n=1 Tax=Tanacetum cinerariifolium TaxID=118510 RepID=A0A6L2KP18_TANCI|nr:hypothetical protein [Tanacetum cinerariifolium]